MVRRLLDPARACRHLFRQTLQKPLTTLFCILGSNEVPFRVLIRLCPVSAHPTCHICIGHGPSTPSLYESSQRRPLCAVTSAMRSRIPSAIRNGSFITDSCRRPRSPPSPELRKFVAGVNAIASCQSSSRSAMRLHRSTCYENSASPG